MVASVAELASLHEVADEVHALVQRDGGWCLSNAGLIGGSVLIDTTATQVRAERLRDVSAIYAGLKVWRGKSSRPDYRRWIPPGRRRSVSSVSCSIPSGWSATCIEPTQRLRAGRWHTDRLTPALAGYGRV